MEERTLKTYNIEAAMEFKEKIKAYDGPGKLEYVNFDFTGLPSRQEIIGGSEERINALFLGTPEEHNAFESYLIKIGLVPPEEETRYEGKIVYLDLNDPDNW
jgi:hypothetical protein